MPLVINVSFNDETEALYNRIEKSRPPGTTLAAHARNLMQRALDSTVDIPFRASSTGKAKR